MRNFIILFFLGLCLTIFFSVNTLALTKYEEYEYGPNEYTRPYKTFFYDEVFGGSKNYHVSKTVTLSTTYSATAGAEAEMSAKDYLKLKFGASASIGTTTTQSSTYAFYGTLSDPDGDGPEYAWIKIQYAPIYYKHSFKKAGYYYDLFNLVWVRDYDLDLWAKKEWDTDNIKFSTSGENYTAN